MIDRLNQLAGFDILIKSRESKYVWARYAACYLLFEIGLTECEIADVVGIDRTTVYYSIRQFKMKMEINDRLAVRFYNLFKHEIL